MGPTTLWRTSQPASDWVLSCLAREPHKLRLLGHTLRKQLLRVAARDGLLVSLRLLAVGPGGREEVGAAGCSLTADVFAAAAKAGQAVACELLRELGCPWDASVFAAAAGAGHLSLCQWLKELGCPRDDSAVTAAADGCHRGVTEWLLGLGDLTEEEARSAPFLAARSGSFALAKRLLPPKLGLFQLVRGVAYGGSVEELDEVLATAPGPGPGVAERRGFTASLEYAAAHAAVSPTQDWRDKVDRLLAAGARAGSVRIRDLGHNGAATGVPKGAFELSGPGLLDRLSWLRRRGVSMSGVSYWILSLGDEVEVSSSGCQHSGVLCIDECPFPPLAQALSTVDMHQYEIKHYTPWLRCTQHVWQRAGNMAGSHQIWLWGHWQQRALSSGDTGSVVWLLDAAQRTSVSLIPGQPWRNDGVDEERLWDDTWRTHLCSVSALRRLWQLRFPADARPWRALLDGSWPEALGALHASHGAPLTVGWGAFCPCSRSKVALAGGVYTKVLYRCVGNTATATHLRAQVAKLGHLWRAALQQGDLLTMEELACIGYKHTVSARELPAIFCSPGLSVPLLAWLLAHGCPADWPRLQRMARLRRETHSAVDAWVAERALEAGVAPLAEGQELEL
jgi:hypothetical protein